jgi:hypothetical protein
MGIGIDGHQAPDLEPRLVPAPIQIEPPWVRIAVLGAGGQNLLDIDLITRPPQRLPRRHVTEDGRIGGWLRRGRCGLFALNAGDDKRRSGRGYGPDSRASCRPGYPTRPGFSKLTRKAADPWRSSAATDQSARRLWPGARARPAQRRERAINLRISEPSNPSPLKHSRRSIQDRRLQAS